MRLLTAADIEAALPMRQAMGVMGDAFAAISGGLATVSERQHLPLGEGTGLLMGASAVGVGLAAKLVSVMPGNAGLGLPGTVGSLLLMDDRTGVPLALMDGTALTAWRTAAAAARATDLLARADADRALLIGCGTQARTQLLGLDAIRELEEIRVHARDARKAKAFIEANSGRVRAKLMPATLPESLRSADIVVTATNSTVPVLAVADIAAGCHVTGIGSFRPGMCEVDPALAGVAGVFVESRDTASAEAGELLAATEAGLTDSTRWTEIGEVLGGVARGRATAGQVTFFKSVGHAVFDLYAARAVYAAARDGDLGREWSG